MAFRLPTVVELGPGTLEKIPEAADSMAPGPVLLVTDEGVLGTPFPERIAGIIRRTGRPVEILSDIEPNPRVATVDRLASEARDLGAVAVVAVGGGSVIDAAKGIALLMRNPGSVGDYEGRDVFERRAAPLVAVPTTCGTGSEVTWVSVLTVAEQGRKISVKGDGLFPVWAIVDADCIVTLPGELVATTAMDAMTHAIEAYVGSRSNPVSDALAEKAVSLLFEYLERTVADPAGDAAAREAVMRASTLAGMAFGNADVGAVHCLSESIGGLFDLPHGVLNAALLVPVLRHHGEAAHARLAGLARTAGQSASPHDAEAAGAMLDALTELARAVRIPRFASLDVPSDRTDEIARLAEANGSNGSNPRVWAASDYAEVLARTRA